MLKNEGGVLPLTKSGRIHLAGFRADDMGVQCGGWSVGWRGHRGAITPGTTIRQGLTEAVGAGRLDFSKDGAGAERADVVVVVVGEDPYAEGGGDRADLALNKEDRALVETVKRTGKPMVVVLISGRPLILGDIVDSAKAHRRRVAARHRGRGRRRRAHRRGQADRQAVVLVAARDGRHSDQRRRREVRSAVPVRPRPELVIAAKAVRGPSASASPSSWRSPACPRARVPTRPPAQRTSAACSTDRGRSIA